MCEIRPRKQSLLSIDFSDSSTHYTLDPDTALQSSNHSHLKSRREGGGGEGDIVLSLFRALHWDRIDVIARNYAPSEQPSCLGLPSVYVLLLGSNRLGYIIQLT